MTAFTSAKTAMTASVLITTVLFFIDEGNFNFQWMTNVFTWIVFVIYAVLVFFGQAVIGKVLPSKLQGFGRIAATVLGGTAMAILFAVCFF